MPEFISKVQYKKSEKGEFHHIAERSLEETIFLVLQYPWDTERSLASVELTCPSVTIEHPNGTYLKAGPYFSGKFSLYYLGPDKVVHLKIADTLKEVCNWVKKYFEQENGLEFNEKYKFVLNPTGHFKTNPFVYQVNTKNALRYFSFLIFMIPVILFMSFLKSMERTEHFDPLIPLWVMLIFLVLFSPLIYLYFHYLKSDKKKCLQLSRGHDVFKFGTPETEKIYTKKDIIKIEAYGMYNSRSLWREAEVFVIAFSTGEEIRFSSLLVAGDVLRSKFPDHDVINNRSYFPML